MTIYQSAEWLPRTYYILENIQSGKKYIGQTTKDINHYLGSGAYWIPHCRKHGGYTRNNIKIVYSKLYESKEEAQQYLDDFKKTNVDYGQPQNEQWANLCEENTEDSPFTGGAHARQMVIDGSHHLLGGAVNNKRVADGTHNFLGGEIGGENNRKRIADGTHHFLGGEMQRRVQTERVRNGTHNLLGETNPVYKQLQDGTHNFLNGTLQRKRLADGTHNFVQTHICPHCNKEGKGAIMLRWHFDNCKLKKQNNND